MTQLPGGHTTPNMSLGGRFGGAGFGCMVQVSGHVVNAGGSPPRAAALLRVQGFEGVRGFLRGHCNLSTGILKRTRLGD